MYDKPYCSFVVPRTEEQIRDDTYYFPENSAFLDWGKVGGLVAAAMMCADPEADFGEKPMARGRLFIANQSLMLCDQNQPTGSTAELQVAPSPSSSSTSRPLTAARPKKAVIKPKPDDEMEYDRAD